MKKLLPLLLVLPTLAATPNPRPASQTPSAPGDWPTYGNDPGGTRFSPLTQLNRQTVTHLKPAWTYHTGDVLTRHNAPGTGFETTPLLVDDTLFLTTGLNRVIALDPVTGQPRWTFDPKIDQTWQSGDGLINRGLATWLDAKQPAGTACRRRLFEATIDARLVAVDAATGAACTDFGTGGEVSLRDVPNFHRGWYHMTSPPAVVDDVVVVGSAIDDNTRVDMPSGVVRAFDVRSGALRWSWNPVPPTLHTGAANAWSIMTVDPVRHLVFVPTGSASPDYYGGLRPGDDKWSDSVVALRAGTGKLAWGFQLVHHDLWDYDVASPPLLATLKHGGTTVPAVIVGNKTGFLYVLNRDTGQPVFPVHEKAVPKSDVPGEVASPTQPIPEAPPALVPQHLTQPWGATPEDLESCRKQLQGLRSEGIFTPPSIQGSVAIPGNIGGMTWSGFAFDPRHGLLVTNTNNLPSEVRLLPRDSAHAESQKLIKEHAEYGGQEGTPYVLYRRYLFSPGNLPCVPPPWGTLTAVDLVHGTLRWQVPLGTFNLAGPNGPPGTISVGGPIVTAGELVFVAGTTLDPHFRAFDLETGKELWSATLPAPGHATPMTYESHGKQYVVIAAGGHAKFSEESPSDTLIAFALP